MRVLVTGNGQLAWELKRTVPPDVKFIGLAREELDITSAEQVKSSISEVKPDAIINAAAYTAVDKAEQEKELAFKVNSLGPELLARQCDKLDAYFLHISSDFVFDGLKCKPYDVESTKRPLGVYGDSKSKGEDIVAQVLAKDWGIIRTAWVYSSRGNNFVKTMLRLMREQSDLSVVDDQISTPTWAKGLALACWAAVLAKAQGVYHWTDAGQASWYDFAVAVQVLGLEHELLEDAIPINRIKTAAYPTIAARPPYSVLDKSKILKALSLEPVHWKDQLGHMIAEFSAQNRHK